MDEGKLWSLIRNVLQQGADVHIDHCGLGYEKYSARLDAAAAERVADFTKLADARIADIERECSQWRDELRIYRETENKRIAELERSVTVRDAEIARLETDLELARRDAERLDWFRTLTPHKLARIRAAFMPDSAGDVRATIDAARAGNGGG